MKLVLSMRIIILQVLIFFIFCQTNSQQLLLLDRFNGNKVVNDSVITVFSSEVGVPELTQYFTMKNNTDKALTVFLRKTVNFYADSTSDYYCFGIRCWPGDDTTNWGDTIPAGGEDFTFASHVTHKRRFDFPQPALQTGLSSITYTVYDKTTFSEPVEATVTVLYHLSGTGIAEEGNGGQDEMAVYPNPASDKITIKSLDIQPGNYNLIIFNSLGAQVKNAHVLSRDHKLQIAVSSLPPGLYSGKLSNGLENRYSFRFLVAR